MNDDELMIATHYIFSSQYKNWSRVLSLNFELEGEISIRWEGVKSAQMETIYHLLCQSLNHMKRPVKNILCYCTVTLKSLRFVKIVIKHYILEMS